MNTRAGDERAAGWLLAVGLVLFASLSLAAGRGAGGAALPGSGMAILVAFKEKAPEGARLNALARAGLVVDAKVRSPYFARVTVGAAAAAAGWDAKAALRLLRRDPSVRVAEPDYPRYTAVVPNDPSFSSLYGLHNTGQSGGTPDADIDAPEAWDQTTGSDSVVVAVIDTGVDYNHPDLTENILRNGNAVVGFDYFNNDPDPMDDNNHGTHVAGTIGARGNNGTGVVGVSWRVKIMPLKFLGASGSGPTSGAIQSIDFARLNGAHIMNNSWGGGGFNQLLLEAIQRARSAGILFAAAAGNDGRDNDSTPHYPSNHNLESDNVIAVAATDRNDLLAGFSNYGAATVDIAAPGAAILSTTPGNTYATFNGTSMATPHLAGAAALLLARYPGLTLAQLKGRLLGSVDRPAALDGRVVTGRLNVHRAMEEDSTAPGAPTGLAATHRSANAVLLGWTTSGDDGAAGRAARYELRYSTQPIDSGNFNGAMAASNLPAPLPSGAPQGHIVTGLDANTAYHFALRAVDNVGNVSPLATTGPVSTAGAVCVLDDNVEGTLRFSGQAPWGVTTLHSSSPTRSYTDSPSGNYANGVDLSLTQTNAVVIGAGETSLTFRARYRLEASFDFVHVEVSTNNGGSWERIGSSLNGISDWTLHSVPLSSYQGQSVKVRFRLITDGSIVDDGVYLDDIRICSVPATCVLQENVEGTPQLSGPAPWGVTTEQSFSPTRSYADSPGSTYQDNLDISLATNTAPLLANMVPILSFRARADLEPGFDFLFVEVSTEIGGAWVRLPLVLNGTTGWQLYSVPLHRFAGQNVRLRFRLITDFSIVADGVYLDDIQICGQTLEPVGPTCSVSVTAPNGGETWAVGSSQQVTWTSQNLSGNVRIELSTNGGATYTTLAASTANDGSETVTVPNTPSAQCRVRVSAVGDSSCADTSDADFVIPGIRGDLNNNGVIDVGDVQLIVNVRRGAAPFVPAIHDLNGNSVIDENDVQIVAGLFVTTGVTTPAPARGSVSASARAPRPKLFRLSLNPGSEPISVVGFDAALGSAVIDSVAVLLDRPDLRMEYNVLPGGTLRVVLYSIDATPIPRTRNLFWVRVFSLRQLRPLRPRTGAAGADGARPAATIVPIPYNRGARRAPSFG